MKFAPRNNQIIGRVVVQRSDRKIVHPDPTKVSKFVLVDAVGEDAVARGIRVGQIVVPKALGNIVLQDGAVYRPVLAEENVAFFLTDFQTADLLVQTENGSAYVPFDSNEAAKPLGQDRPGVVPTVAA